MERDLTASMEDIIESMPMSLMRCYTAGMWRINPETFRPTAIKLLSFSSCGNRLCSIGTSFQPPNFHNTGIYNSYDTLCYAPQVE